MRWDRGGSDGLPGYGIETVLSYESLAILLYTFVIQSFRFGGIWPSKKAPFCIPLQVIGVAVGVKGTILRSSSRCWQEAVWSGLNFAGCHVDFFYQLLPVKVKHILFSLCFTSTFCHSLVTNSILYVLFDSTVTLQTFASYANKFRISLVNSTMNCSSTTCP